MRAGYAPWGIVRLFAARLVWGGVIGFLALVALLALMWALAASSRAAWSASTRPGC